MLSIIIAFGKGKEYLKDCFDSIKEQDYKDIETVLVLDKANINPEENIEKLIGLGVDYITSGALTHSAPILDVSLKGLHVI